MASVIRREVALILDYKSGSGEASRRTDRRLIITLPLTNAATVDPLVNRIMLHAWDRRISIVA